MPLGIGMYQVAGVDFAVELYCTAGPDVYAVNLVCRGSDVFHYVV
jgi:hypothetical protein